MATRLEIAHGLIAEPDRIATSADTLSVTRPDTGSRTRSKGALFVVVSSSEGGPRAREATLLVADTIRREYYYDESAGIPVCIEKAVRSADRRLRGSREGAGLMAGSLGVGVGVVRNNELYLAAMGAVEAYFVRAARLLMPERHVAPGLPSDEGLKVDVWRGELSVGDALLIVSRNLTETVGTEELKSAVLTLHPQAAVEHLHHLFVAAGGAGSDAVLAVEAREQKTHLASRAPRSASSGGYGDLPGVPGQPMAGGAGSLLVGTRDPLGLGMAGVLDRIWETMPRRRASATGLSPRMSRAETQRRAALGALAFIGIVFVLGLLVMVLPRGGERTPQQVSGGDSALAAARDSVDRAANIASTDPEGALAFYREAWNEVGRARQTGLAAAALDELESRVRAGLDGLHGALAPAAKTITGFDESVDPTGLVRGPDAAVYYLDRAGPWVTRVDPADGSAVEIVTRGDKPASGGNRIGSVTQIEAGGPDVVIIDDEARAWRWRPSDDTGRGTLARLTFLGDSKWGEDHGDVETFASPSGYRMYVVEPSRRQILRYQQTFDGSAFQVPSPYLVTESDEVADFRELHIDSDLYALATDGVQKYEFGRFQPFDLEEMPDEADLRPGHDFRLLTGTGSDSTGGLLYLYDAKWDRVVVFEKADGSFVRQWLPGPDGPSMEDMRGFVVVPGSKKRPDTLYWMTPEGIFDAVLSAQGEDVPGISAPGGREPRNKGRKKSGS